MRSIFTRPFNSNLMPKWLKDNFANVAGHVPLKPKPNVFKWQRCQYYEMVPWGLHEWSCSPGSSGNYLVWQVKSKPLPIIEAHISVSNIKFSCFFFKIWRIPSLFVGPLIPLLWTGFQSEGEFLTCVLTCLCAMDSSDSPLVRHLPTSLMANMATKPFLSMYLSIHTQALVGFEPSQPYRLWN